VTLVADVARLLERHGVSFAMIGAAATAVHGVSRSTADVDLLTMDVRCLSDLMLLKLYAGGPHDAWDIDQLLTVDVSGDAARDVDDHVGDLPADASALWMKIRHGR
jgi:predicted nucleotidyltransferase